MKLKKRWIFAALVAIFALAMVGCGDSGGGDDPPPSKINITFAARDTTGATVDAEDFTGTFPTAKLSQAIPYTVVAADVPVLTYDGDGEDDNGDPWIFYGWYVNGVTTTTAVKAGDTFSVNTSLVAVFGPDTRITITFDIEQPAGETMDYSSVTPAPVKILPGQPLASQIPGKVEYLGTADYLFDNWYLGNDPVDPDTTKFDAAATVTGKFVEGWRVTFWQEKAKTNKIDSIVISKGSSFDLDGVDLPDPPDRSAEFYDFNHWAKVSDDTAFDEETTVTAALDVYAVWDNTGFGPITNDPGAEKVRLANGAFVIYEFNLKGAGVTGTGPNGDIIVDDLAAITEISLTQAINEESYNNRSVRGMRVYGPYAYNDDDIIVNQGSWSNGDVLRGDFKVTAEGMYIAKMNGSGDYTTADLRTFNKFHPYMSYNNATRFGHNQTVGWNDVSSITEITTDPADSGAIKAETWFGVKYPMVGTIPATDTKAQNLGSTLLRIKEAGTDVLPYGTNYNKVYFAIGPSTEDTDLKITYLMKDVSLKIGAVDVDGVIPDWDGNPATREQTFACYEDDNRAGNWRGEPGVVIQELTLGGANADTYNGPRDALHTESETEGYFYLRLGDYKTPSGAGTGPHPTPAEDSASSFGGKFTQGPLTLKFNEQNEKVNIALTPSQIELLANSDATVKVTIVATADSNEQNNFRYFLGDGSLGSGWNLSAAGGPGHFSTLIGAENAKEIAINAGKAPDLKHFILQMAPNTAAVDSETIVITSIRIDYNYNPPEPPSYTPATVDLQIITSANALTLTKSFTNQYSNIEFALDGTTAGNSTDAVTIAGGGTINTALPAGLQLGSYASYTLKLEVYDASDNVIGGEVIQFAFVSSTANFWDNRLGGDFGNAPPAGGFVEKAFRNIEKDASVIAGFYMQNKVAFEKLVITEFTLHAPD